MNAREKDGVARLLNAFTTFQPVQDAHQQVIESVRLLAGGNMGHMFDLPVCINPTKAATGQSGFLGFSEGVPDKLEQFKKLHDHYVPYSPLAAAIPRVLTENRLAVALNEEIIGEKAWRGCQMYNEFARPLDESSGVALFIRDPATDRIRWAACLTAPNDMTKELIRRKPFLNWTLNHLSLGMKRLRQWGGLFERSIALETLLQQSSSALALLTAPRHHQPARLIACNPAMEKLLNPNGAADSRNAVLADFLTRCEVSMNVTAPSVNWTAADGRPCQLQFLKSDAMHLLVHAYCAQHPVSPSIFEAAKSFGLTDRESEVMALIAEGCGDKDVAARLSIAFNTARAHARNIFAKLKVAGRMEAINKLRDPAASR